MRWIIGIVVLASLAVVGWFAYQRYAPVTETAVSSVLPAETFLIITETVPADHFDSTSLAILNGIPELESLHNKLLQIGKFKRSNESGTYFLYGSSNHPKLGVVASTTESESTNALAHTLVREEYLLRTETELSSARLALPSFTWKAGEIYLDIYAMLSESSSSNSNEAYQPLLNLFTKPLWTSISVDGSSNGFSIHAIGLGKTHTPGPNTGQTAFRILPSTTKYAILNNSDSLDFCLAYCPYSGASNADHNQAELIVITPLLQEGFEEIDQYRNMPISTGTLPAFLADYNIEWETEAFVAQVGQQLVYAASFKQLAQFIDDFLADDKLISSPYYLGLSDEISDSYFTFYLRPDAGSNINALVFQIANEVSSKSFYSFNAIHSRDIKNEAAVLWSTLCDTTITGGPWPFVNHYTNEPELLVQDAKDQLYLINRNGKTLWKKQLKGQIVKDIISLDMYSSQRFQVLCSTSEALYLIDRNGKDVESFPVSLSNGSQAMPAAIKYHGRDEYRVLFADGEYIRNVDAEGKAVKGWRKPKIESGALQQVQYIYENGKDYLICLSQDQKIHGLDRTGKTRWSARQMDMKASDWKYFTGSDLASAQWIGHDSLGHILATNALGKQEAENILPLGSDIGFFTTQNEQFRFITSKNDRIIALNNDYDVTLDYLVPQDVSHHIQVFDRNTMWIGLEAKDEAKFYLLSADGRMLDKMPVDGRGKALVIDLDDNGSSELVIANDGRKLQTYRLTD